MKGRETTDPRNISTGSRLPLMESFYTLQGEGFFQGVAAYFIRLGGCDVGCVWCDVKESWPLDTHPMMEVGWIASQAAASGAPIAVVTGGEPAMYDLTQLTESLHMRKLRTHIETSGAYELTGQWDWVCLSPKKFKTPMPSTYSRANELKVVIYNRHDFDWAEFEAVKVGKGCKLFLQPEWSREKQMLPLIVDYVKAHPQWRVSLQVHKYMNIP